MGRNEKGTAALDHGVLGGIDHKRKQSFKERVGLRDPSPYSL